MKTTIFVRLLLATLLPMILVLGLVIATIHNIVYERGANFARGMALTSARQLSKQISVKVRATASLLEVASQGLSGADYNSPEARLKPSQTLRTLLNADAAIFSAWFAYEPGTFLDGRHYYQTLIRDADGFREIQDLSPEILRDARKSPWYNEALSSGRPYMDMMDYYDYGPGQGTVLTVNQVYPIFAFGWPIGCLGLDFRFEDLFDTQTLQFGQGQKLILVSDQGRILSSSDGRSLESDNLFGFSFLEPQAIRQALAEGGTYLGETLSPFSGVPAFICLTPVILDRGQGSIFLYMDIPAEELYASTRSSLELIVSTSVLGLLLLLFSVFVATRNIVRPIRQLTSDFNKISHGDLDIASRKDDENQAGSSRLVELDILRLALLKMLDQINLTHELSLAAAEEKVEKEKVLAASEAKTLFFAKMSHEIRTPMNAILGISEILLRDEPLTEKQTAYIKDIKISSDSLLGIINDILDISRLETGKLALSPVNYNFPKFLGHLRSLVSHLAAGKNLEFNYEQEGELPACLLGDDSRLRQVLLNIIGNAVKFTAEGSVTLKVSVTGPELSFTVVDTGVGIRQEELAFLFEPFKQADNPKNRSIQGSGLGLSIARNLVELMNGRIEVKSDFGHGSSFRVSLPWTPGESPEADGLCVARAVAFSPQLKILIVDDNAINLSVAAGLLKTIYGLDSDLASSGAEALEKIKKTDYHLVFMDHMMPGMDGLEATARIRALGGKYARLTIVALTANAVAGAREMMLASGVDDFLTKPIVNEDLDAVLDRWIPAGFKTYPGGPETAALKAPEKDGPAPSPSPLMARLGDLKELEPASALASLAGEEALYLGMLGLLRDEIPAQVEHLNQAWEHGDLKALMIQVHGLKSALASIGALSLSALARDLEETAADGRRDFYAEKIPLFTRRLAELGRRLEPALSEAELDGSRLAPDEDDPALEQDYGRLAQTLAVYDYEAIGRSLARLQAAETRPQARELLKKIKKTLRDFDYERAAEILADFRASADRAAT
ncbi:MAG: response regulator [Candidatus Adiutrix sp.]|nr:response regulator [Candidatus Adiutrix sp.]